MRASGVRSSWLQLASSSRWAATSSSMRSAERLKLCGQRRDLVAALDLDARAEIAAAELLDAGLQPLEPPAEAAHHRIGADRDGEREQREAAHDPQDRARSARAPGGRPASGRRAAAG